MRAALAVLMLLAAPVAAQQADEGQSDAPVFDPLIVDACVTGQTGLAREACIGVAAARCMDSEGGSTTVGAGFCLGQELDYWDGRLNAAYAGLIARAEAMDAEMEELGSAVEKQAPALREMQRHWIAYRDAACVYERSRWGGGTGGGPASADCAMSLTAKQTLRLEDYRREDPE